MTIPTERSHSLPSSDPDMAIAPGQDGVESHRRRLLRAAASGVPLMLTVSGASAAAQSGWERHAANLPNVATLPDATKSVGAVCPDNFVRQLVTTWEFGTNNGSNACDIGNTRVTYLLIGSQYYRRESTGVYTAVSGLPTNRTLCSGPTNSYNVVLFAVDSVSKSVQAVSPNPVWPIATSGKAMYGSAYTSLTGVTASSYTCPGT